MSVEAAVSDTVRDALLPTLTAAPFVLAAWHYGSSLRSDYRPGVSDIDILLVVTDDTTVDQYAQACTAVCACVPDAEVTVLRRAEVDAGIHPGWSRHFFINVARSGRRLYGPDLLVDVARLPLRLEDAFRRLVELTQRARLVCLNPSKQTEGLFWLGKYQHWVPLVLMELLELADSPEDRLHLAHSTFCEQFTPLGTDVPFPYPSLLAVTSFLEELIRWVPANAQLFGGTSTLQWPV